MAKTKTEKTTKTREQIFAAAFAKRKSTGNQRLDAACDRILTAIRTKDAVVAEAENGFQVTMGKVTAKVEKIAVGKSKRTVVDIAGIPVTGSYANWFWRLSNQAMKPAATARPAKTMEITEEQEALLTELLEE